MPARNPYLDAIRAAAIVLVVFHHISGFCVLPRWPALLGLRGYVGVDLFFVLSGWLIGGQLFRTIQRTGRVDLARFWLRRWWRTLPAYYAVLPAVWVTSSLAGGWSFGHVPSSGVRRVIRFD